MRQLILHSIIFLSLLGICSARLGETKEALIAKLGQPTEQEDLPQAAGVQLLQWNQENKRVYEVWIYKQESVLESIAEPMGVEIAEVKKFLTAQGSGWQQIQSNSRGVAYHTTQGNYLAFASVARDHRIITVMVINKDKMPPVR
jgi:hypothetical protein